MSHNVACRGVAQKPSYPKKAPKKECGAALSPIRRRHFDQTRNFPHRRGFYSVCMEAWEMLKKTVAALFGLVFAMALITPPKANAEVVFGVGVGARPGYGYVAARPRPYGYVAPAPYVAYAPGYVYPPAVYPGNVVVGVGYGGWYGRPYGGRYARPYAYRYNGGRGYGWRR
jgi:hypothetical protein